MTSSAANGRTIVFADIEGRSAGGSAGLSPITHTMGGLSPLTHTMLDPVFGTLPAPTSTLPQPTTPQRRPRSSRPTATISTTSGTSISWATSRRSGRSSRAPTSTSASTTTASKPTIPISTTTTTPRARSQCSSSARSASIPTSRSIGTGTRTERRSRVSSRRSATASAPSASRTAAASPAFPFSAAPPTSTTASTDSSQALGQADELRHHQQQLGRHALPSISLRFRRTTRSTPAGCTRSRKGGSTSEGNKLGTIIVKAAGNDNLNTNGDQANTTRATIIVGAYDDDRRCLLLFELRRQPAGLGPVERRPSRVHLAARCPHRSRPRDHRLDLGGYG